MASFKDILNLIRGTGAPACCAVSIEALPEPSEAEAPDTETAAEPRPTPDGAPGDA